MLVSVGAGVGGTTGAITLCFLPVSVMFFTGIGCCT